MSASEPRAFYLPEGRGCVRATGWTRGPWDVRTQHGGPPSALLAREVDAAIGEDAAAWVPVRTVIELLRPVPIATLCARAEVTSRGRTALRAVATLEHDRQEVARARVILVRAVAPDPSMACAAVDEAWPDPEASPPFTFTFFPDPVGFHTAVTLRGPSAWPRASTRAWSRVDVDLVAGAPPTGWQRALCIADAAHGLAPGLDPRTFTLINPDLELSLLRRPVGVWVGLDVTTTTRAVGTGVTRATVADVDGTAGACSATLVVRRRA